MATDLTARFRTLYTGAIADVLDEMGVGVGALPRELVPLASGMRIAGPIFAIEGRSHPDMDHDASMRKILTMLSAVPSGHVAVYQPDDDASSHLGELSAEALQRAGCIGAVIDGGCRDVGHILDLGFPVFCRYVTPIDAVGRWEVLRYGHSVSIGGVHIATGDYLVADRDGAIVVPAEIAERVLEQAERVASTENEVRDAVRFGLAPLDAYERHGRF